jgi:hypothetical protein
MTDTPEEAVDLLMGLNWSREQACALAASLVVNDGIPPSRADRLHDWASAHDRMDKTKLSTMAKFTHHELTASGLTSLGRKLLATESVEQAIDTLTPYWPLSLNRDTKIQVAQALMTDKETE